jgi:hypothetical protein
MNDLYVAWIAASGCAVLSWLWHASLADYVPPAAEANLFSNRRAATVAGAARVIGLEAALAERDRPLPNAARAIEGGL